MSNKEGKKKYSDYELIEKHPFLEKELFRPTVQVLRSAREVLGEIETYERKTARIAYVMQDIEREINEIEAFVKRCEQTYKYVKGVLDEVKKYEGKLDELINRVESLKKFVSTETALLQQRARTEVELYKELLEKYREFARSTDVEKIADHYEDLWRLMFPPIKPEEHEETKT